MEEAKTRLGAKIVSYADDFVICCKGSAEEAMTEMRRLMTQLGLTNQRPQTRVSSKPASHISMNTSSCCLASPAGFFVQLKLPFGRPLRPFLPAMSAPPLWLELHRLVGGLPCGGDEGSHALGGLAHRVVMQMAVASRRDRARMS